MAQSRLKISTSFRRVIRDMIVPGVCEVLLFGYLSWRRVRTKLSRVLFAGSEQTVVKSVVHISVMSHQQYYLVQAFRRHDVKSVFVALNTDPDGRLNVGYDFGVPATLGPRLSMFYRFVLFWGVVMRYDVVHYHFNSFLWGDDGQELPYLKRAKKVIVFHFRGCDLRSRSANSKAHPVLNVCQKCDYPEGSCDTEYQRKKIHRAREFGDLFFVTTPDLAVLFPGSIHVPFILPAEIDFDAVVPEVKTENVFRVVTSSNHPGLDGVPYIRKAVSQLISEGYNVELREVEKEPFQQTLSAYMSADLYVSKLRMGFYNNSNIETMMMGVANISYIDEKYQSIYSDCPIIVGTPDTVYERIKFCIENPSFVSAHANKGRDFVCRRHDESVVIPLMMEHYNQAFCSKLCGSK